MIKLRPYFYSRKKEKRSDEVWKSFSVEDMREEEFKTVTAYASASKKEQFIIDQFWTFIENRTDVKSLEDLKRVLKEAVDNTSLSKSDIDQLDRRFFYLEKSGLFQEHHAKDMQSYFAEYPFITVNHEGHESYGDENEADTVSNYPRIFTRLLTDQIRSLRVQKKIQPVWFFMDEAARFVKKSEMGKGMVNKSVDLDRRYDISWYVVTQNIQDLPQPLIDATKYFCLPSSIRVDSLQKILSSLGMLKIDAQQKERLARLKRKSKEFDWFIIDTHAMKVTIVQPLAPLSYHLETR